jgi:O-antigen/teichoic acid export membrane protein
LLAFAYDALPTGIATLALISSWRIGIVALLPMGVPQEEVGLYSAANRVIEGARFFPAAVAAGLFPAFAARRPGIRPWRILLFLLPPAIFASLVFSSTAVSSFLVRLLYGIRYAGAETMLSTLMWSFPFVTINSVLTYWLVARGSQVLNALICVGHLAINVSALILLVPGMGANGAAAAFVLAEVCAAAAALLVLRTGRLA